MTAVMTEHRFRLGAGTVVVHTWGSIMVMTSDRRLVEVALVHKDETLTIAPPPKPPRVYNNPKIRAKDRRVRRVPGRANHAK